MAEEKSKFNQVWEKYHVFIIGAQILIATLIHKAWGGDFDIIKACAYLGVAILLNLTIVGVSAWKTFDKTEKLPWPAWFWSFVFNRLGTVKGRDVTNDSTSILILSIQDPSSLTIISELQRRYHDGRIVIPDQFSLQPDHQWDDKLDVDHFNYVLATNRDAVLVVRSRSLEEKFPQVYDLLERWAEKNSHIPILFLKLPEDDIDYFEDNDINLSLIPDRFNSVERDALELIPWLFLTHGRQRSFAWKDQATRNRWLGIAGFVLLVGLSASWYFWRNHSLATERQDQENQFASFTEAMDEVLTAKSSVRYIEFSKLALDFYGRKLDLSNQEKAGLSLALYEINESSQKFEQIGWTYDNKVPDNWSINAPTIIGCSFYHPNHFVLYHHAWKTNPSSSKPTALWSYGNQTSVEGQFDFHAGAILVKEKGTPLDTCAFKPNPRDIQSLICFTFSDDKSEPCAVCLESKKDFDKINSLESQEFIRGIAKSVATFDRD